MVQSRSSIIQKIFEIKEETCPKVCIHESIISPEDSNSYPLDPSKVTSVSIESVVQAVIEGEKTASFKDGNALEHLLQFEPYAQFGKDILQELFTANNSEVVTEQFLRQILDSVQCKETVALFKAITSQAPTQPECQHSFKESADNQALFEEF